MEHSSSVNFENLIRDLAEMYPFEISDVIIVELIANALDAKARNICIDYSPTSRILVIKDDGKGMTADQFDEYHDFAAGLKIRGSGIGFAGVGAKISFNIAKRVVTETKSKNFSGGSDWYLKSSRELIWKDIKPKRLNNYGTRIQVEFNKASPVTYRNTTDLKALLKTHYLPLVDEKFLSLYNKLGVYPKNLRFYVNGNIIKPICIKDEFKLTEIREFYPGKKNKTGLGIFGISKNEYPVSENHSGVLLSTYGKVVKSDFFNQYPGELGSRIFGIVEVPDFINFLTTNKTDFMRGRKRYKKFESLYKPLRDEFKEWLKIAGVNSAEYEKTDEARKIERELRKLVEHIPELGEFLGFRTKKHILQLSKEGEVSSILKEGANTTFPDGEGEASKDKDGVLDEGEGEGNSLKQDDQGNKPATPISRKSHRGPKITFLSSPEKVEVAWVESNTIVINSSHPAYLKAIKNNIAKKVFCFFAIGHAVQKCFSSSEELNPDLNLTDRIMKAWGMQ